MWIKALDMFQRGGGWQFDGQGPCMFVVWLGANDAAVPGALASQHVPLDEFKHNLISLVSCLRGDGTAHHSVLLLTPPPVDEEHYDQFCRDSSRPTRSRRFEVTKKYAEAVVEVAEILRVPVLDCFSAMTVEGDANWKEMLSDGLHLSSKGYGFLWKILRRCIAEEMPSMSAEARKLDAPIWRELLSEDIDASWSNANPSAPV